MVEPGDSMSGDPGEERARLARALRREASRRNWHGHRRLPARGPELASSTVAPEPAPATQVARPPSPADAAGRPAQESPRTAGPRSAPRAAPAPPQAPRETQPAQRQTQPAQREPRHGELTDRVAAVRQQAQACADLQQLAAAISQCRACSLCETRTQTVFQDGNGSTGVAFVGEAPGQREDETGVPFVGEAGQLLTAIIENGMGLQRPEVAILNVVKCRPPGNRDPRPEEKALCKPWLERQLELLAPRVLIPLGKHAAGSLLGRPEATMGSMRGTIHRNQGIPVVPTYHPAYLLRNPGDKRLCWQDIQLAMRELGLEGPRPASP